MGMGKKKKIRGGCRNKGGCRRERDGCRYKGGIVDAGNVVVAIKGVETWLMQEMWLLRGRNSAIKGAATGEVVAAAGDVDVLGKVAGSKRF